MTRRRDKGEAVADQGKDDGVVDHETEIDAGTAGGADQERGTGQGREAAETTEMIDEGIIFPWSNLFNSHLAFCIGIVIDTEGDQDHVQEKEDDQDHSDDQDNSLGMILDTRSQIIMVISD